MSGGDRRFRIEAAIAFTLSAVLILCAWRKWLPLKLTEAFGVQTLPWQLVR